MDFTIIDCVRIIISADTIVDLDNVVLEKPQDEEHAKEMLRAMSGKMHQVHTGVVIMEQKKGSFEFEQGCTFITTTKVKFAPLSEQAMDAYVKTKEPFDKAGGYGIQGYGRALVQSVEGDFFNVAGFPCFDFASHFAERLTELFPEEAASIDTNHKRTKRSG
jgi:septum formation protein